MWIFSLDGFFSVTRSPLEAEKFQVRARLEHDLKNLLQTCQKRFPQSGWDQLDILTTGHTDYRHRIIVTAEQRTELLTALGDEISYTNFKSAVGKRPDQREKVGALHDIWEVMYKFQKRG